MSRRRFYAPPAAFNFKSATVTLEADEARHLRDVLRLKTGDDVSVFDGQGKEFHGRVAESRRDWATIDIVAEVTPQRPESPLRLNLAVALLKGEKFDLVVQKTTELGVTQVIPVATKLADVRLRDESDASKRVTRWQRIALEAAKQSGRARVPIIAAPLPLEQFINDPNLNGPRLLFTEREGHSLADAQAQLTNATDLTILIGAEGGWTDAELDLAKENGWLLVTLGGRVMRAETAAISITALLQHLYGDLR
jgi:16S rRNA (uracil1498-N3)-methyltransferase